MKHSLAKALLDAGIQHFDTGGNVLVGGLGGMITPQNQFQASVPTINQQNLNPAIQTSMQRNADVYSQQNNLAKALLSQSQGQGPNPAQTALATNTGANVANTAALMAGQRGANSNPGLVARNAAMAGAGAEQTAAGQAATLQAQQELAAQNELAGIYGSQSGSALQEESILQGANAAQNSANTTGQLGAQQINAGVSQGNANNAASGIGGIIGSIGSVAGSIGSGIGSAVSGIGNFFGFADGGEIPGYDAGGIASYATPTDPRIVLNVGQAKPNEQIQKGLTKGFGDLFSPGKTAGVPGAAGAGFGSPSLGVDTSIDAPSSIGIPGVVGNAPAIPDLMPSFGAPAALSTPGLGVDMGLGLSGIADAGAGAAGVGDLAELALLANKGGAIDYRSGGPVPGKAEVDGDNPKNDTVPAMLSPGEDVLPRSVTQAPDAPERAKRFVQALMDKKGEGPGFAKVLKARGNLKDRVARLEKLCGGGMA